MRALHVVLVEPEIHWNTGNTGRSCLAAGAQLHLVEPFFFGPRAERVVHLPMRDEELRSLNVSGAGWGVPDRHRADDPTDGA